jgi:hypothetical protein
VSRPTPTSGPDEAATGSNVAWMNELPRMRAIAAAVFAALPLLSPA